MRAPATPESKTAGYTALCAASASAGRAGSPAEAVDRFLRTLVDAGQISAALVEIDSKPVLRISAGDDVETSQDDLVLKALKTRSAPAACLYVAGPVRRSRGLLTAIGQQLALTIDLAFLREQTKD